MTDVKLQAADIGVIILYLVAVVVIGIRAMRRESRTEEDYLLAGRRLTVPMFVATLVASWYGGILGVGEYSYTYGLSQWLVLGAPYYFFGLLFALFLASRVRESKVISLPERLQQTYGGGAARLGALYTFFMINPAPYMLMMATLLQLIVGGDGVWMLIVGTLLSTLYLWLGGFRSVTATNVLEFAMMYLGFASILPFCYERYGGVDFLLERLPPLHLTWHGGNSWQTLLVWFFIALWTLVDPGFHQRCAAAKNGAVARRGILWSVVFWVLFDAMTVTTGLYARAVLPNLEQPSLAYPALAGEVLPAGVRGLFWVGMLATVMSTLVSYSFLAAQTLGRDLFAPAGSSTSNSASISRTRWGLVVSLGVGALMALWLPSVISLWYTVGSLFVPGLLLPVLLSYSPRWRPGSRGAVSMMLVAVLSSSAWWAVGIAQGSREAPVYPWGLEPLYPGLLASAAVYGVISTLRRRTKRQANA